MEKEKNTYSLYDEWNKFVLGKLSSFKIIFEKTYEEMFGYGLKICSHPEIVEDSIQDLFQFIWERREDLNHIYSPRVYLFVSLRRKILKKQNDRRSFRTKDDLEKLKNKYIIKKGAEHIIIKKERASQQKKALSNAMDQLSKRQKRVVHLYYFNGMNFGEIKKILSVNRQSVYNYMYRAKETLKAVIDTDVEKQY